MVSQNKELEGFWCWHKTPNERLGHLVELVARGLGAESRRFKMYHTEASKTQPWLITPPNGVEFTEAQLEEARRLVGDIITEQQ